MGVGNLRLGGGSHGIDDAWRRLSCTWHVVSPARSFVFFGSSEPEERQVRPAIRVVGWVFVCIAAVTVVASVIVILSGE